MKFAKWNCEGQRKKILWALGLAVLVLWLVRPAEAAGNLELEDQITIAPASIPVSSAGNAPDKVGMVRLDLVVNPGFIGTTDTLDSFEVELTGDIPSGKIQNLYVYYEEQDDGVTNDGKFDTDPTKLVKTINGVDLSSPVTVDTFSTTITIKKYNDGGTAYIYVAFDFVSGTLDTQDTKKTVGCKIINVNGDTGANGQPPETNIFTVNLDNYAVTVAGDTSGLGLATADPGPGDTQSALRLEFGIADTSLFSAPATGGYATIDAIRFHNVGTAADADFDAASAIIVFLDDGDKIYETGEELGSGSISGGYATVSLATPLSIYDAHATCYAAVRLSNETTHGNTVALRVEDPSDTANISFADGIDDTALGYVVADTNSQVGYISGSGAQPASPDAFTIITDPDPPEVSDTTPVADAPGVSRYLSEIRVVFNEDVDPATIVDANFELKETVSGTPIGGSVSMSGDNVLVFSITPDLSYDTSYTATVTGPGGIADLVGNEMAADYSWSFQTEPPVPPIVNSVYPEEDATDVAVDIASVRAVFSEPMTPGTITAANFSLVGPSGAVDGSVSYDDAGSVYRLVFVPDADLEYDKTYTATVTTGVQDTDGLNMLSDKVWQFTTIRLYPEFDEPIAIKNRIGSGTHDQALIFVTQPPGGAGTRMTVQAFTATGKLVRTFFRNVPWSTIGEDPIAWDGTNDRGQKLGPGLYFVQIRAADYKRVLKVMIVR